MKRLYILLLAVVILATIGISNKQYPKNETKNTNTGEIEMSLIQRVKNHLTSLGEDGFWDPLGLLNSRGAGTSQPHGGGGYNGPQGEQGASPLTTTLQPYQGATPQPMQNYSGSSGGDGGAAAAAAQKQANLLSGFMGQKDNTINTANEAITNSANTTRSSVLDFIGGYKQGQDKINLAGTKNELAKKQGMAGVQGMVGRGIRSGGVTLANKNASDSSAAGAIARAYADIGGREMRGIGQQYESNNQDIALEQQGLYGQADTFGRKLEENKTSIVNNIVSQVRNSLAELDARMTQEDLPGRIAIEQEKEAVRSRALSSLSEFDAMLRNERAKYNPTSVDERRRQAAEMENAGTSLGADAFSYSESTPAQFQGTGPFASELPIFTRPRTRTE